MNIRSKLLIFFAVFYSLSSYSAAQEYPPALPKISVDTSKMGDSPIAAALKRHVNISTPRMDQEDVRKFLKKNGAGVAEVSQEKVENLGFKCNTQSSCLYSGQYSFKVTDGQLQVKTTDFLFEVELDLSKNPIGVLTRRVPLTN